tara:strand:+ start:315 stop:608 length:294 start_codon:yes stop_codon:yes gene_type:complete
MYNAKEMVNPTPNDGFSCAVVGLQHLCEEFNMTTMRDLLNFMCKGEASAISSDRAEMFWKGLQHLHEEFNMTTTKDLLKFMSGSVAAAISSDRAERF